MTLTFQTILAFLGVLQLLLAALNVPGGARWNFGWGGAFTVAVAYLVTIST